MRRRASSPTTPSCRRRRPTPTQRQPVTQSVTIGPAVSALDVTKTADAPTRSSPASARSATRSTSRTTARPTPNRHRDRHPARRLLGGLGDHRSWHLHGHPGPTGDTVKCDLGGLVAPFRRRRSDRSGHDRRDRPRHCRPGRLPKRRDRRRPIVTTDEQPAGASDRRGPRQRVDRQVVPRGSDPDITPGTTETYRIRVVNDGPSVATDVVVTDVLPPDSHPARTVVAATPRRRCATSPPSRAISATSHRARPWRWSSTCRRGRPRSRRGVTNTATVATPRPIRTRATTPAGSPCRRSQQADLSIRKIAPTEPPIAGRRRRTSRSRAGRSTSKSPTSGRPPRAASRSPTRCRPA